MRESLLLSLMLVTLLVSCATPELEENSAESVPESAPVENVATPNLATLGQLARQAKDQEDWPTARDLYLQAVEVAPGHPVVYERLAEVEVRLGELEQAIDRLGILAALGGTTAAIDQPVFEPLVGKPRFEEIAGRIRQNGAPQDPAEIFLTFDEPRLSPEGIARDAETGDLYVGSFLLRKIVRVGADGEVTDLGSSADHDLGAVLGMWVDSPRRHLWAVAGSTSMEAMTHPAELVQYDIETGDLVARFPAPNQDQTILLNDVVVTPDGTAWATESLFGGLYRVPTGGGELELFKALPEFGFANGIAASGDGSTIYVAHAEGLSAIDAATGTVERVVAEGEFTLVSADGLNWADGALVLVQNQPSLNNRVIVVDLDASGRRATGIRQLAIGLPKGLEPYTCAVAKDVVYVTVSPPIDPNADLVGAPHPAIARLPL